MVIMTMSKEVKDEVKLYISQGYEIKEETNEYVLMQKNTTIGMHIILGLLFWWLCFIPNIIYYFAYTKKSTISKKF